MNGNVLTCGLLALSLTKGCSPVLLFKGVLAMTSMSEDLQVYQKAIGPADGVAALTEGFPRGCYYLVDQLNRAALSIATNLAEGNGRFTKADRRNFFTMD